MGGHVYLVEMKWWNRPLGPGEVSTHLVRLFSRSGARGIFISASGYTDAAVGNCRDAFQGRVLVLPYPGIDHAPPGARGILQQWLRTKENAAVNDRNPWFPFLS